MSGEAPRTEGEAVREERRRLRRLRLLIDMSVARLMQEEMTLTQALALVEEARRGALALFPDKRFAFELIYRPRLMRIVRERWPAAGDRESRRTERSRERTDDPGIEDEPAE